MENRVMKCGHDISNKDVALESKTRFCRMCDLQARVRDAETMEMSLLADKERLKVENKVLLGHLLNLLARIHRDGGHRVEEVGMQEAVRLADLIVANLNMQIDGISKLPQPTGSRGEKIPLRKHE